ncbi:MULTISPECIES: YlbG family protein [unclassified Lactobacillus]|uniref:YlbG family protein n=1 Tax=unclassified Lactobacillus TaxID=2620435 RepID=UPI0023F916AA|nr:MULTISPECIES: YlbG family protein [unclassified Lactobacillus]MDF7668411.1 YlbG family protein [Lactobacillus sp. ESL0703]WEV39367.1 YlbG family protein [Lactobacillus sp. ESL0680]
MSVNQDLQDTPITKRQGLIVYLDSASNQYKLRHYGDIVYFSKKMCYCVLYTDQKEIDQVMQKLTALDFVKKVEKSSEENLDLSSSHIEQQITEMAQAAEDKLLKEQEKLEHLS